MPLPRLAGTGAVAVEHRAVQPAGRLARVDLLDQVRDALQNPRRMIHVVAHILDLRRTRQHQIRMHPRLEGAPDVRLHRVADHHHILRLRQRQLRQLFTGAMEHVPVRLAQVIRPAPRARLQKRRRRPRPRPRLLARDRAPVVRVRRQQPRPALDALVRLRQPLHRCAPLAHHHVMRPDRIARDLPLMQRRKQTALADHEHRA